uniref:Uncharacterized protein n=1 Tax=Anguilla anguilla TaxID=7936 RepID=A0A0E9WF32_ANGAN
MIILIYNTSWRHSSSRPISQKGHASPKIGPMIALTASFTGWLSSQVHRRP